MKSREVDYSSWHLFQYIKKIKTGIMSDEISDRVDSNLRSRYIIFLSTPTISKESLHQGQPGSFL